MHKSKGWSEADTVALGRLSAWQGERKTPGAAPCPCSPLSSSPLLDLPTTSSPAHTEVPGPGSPGSYCTDATVPWDGSFNGFLHRLSLHSTTQAVTHLRFLDFQQARTCPPTSVLQEDWLVKVPLILIFWLFSSRPSFSVLIPQSHK